MRQNEMNVTRMKVCTTAEGVYEWYDSDECYKRNKELNGTKLINGTKVLNDKDVKNGMELINDMKGNDSDMVRKMQESYHESAEYQESEYVYESHL